MSDGESDPPSIGELAPAAGSGPAIREPAPSPEPSPLPGAWATLGGGLDLSLSANRELRRASLYIGLLTLLTIGPFAVIILAFGKAQGGFDWIPQAMAGLQPDLVYVDPSVGLFMIVAGCVAAIGLFVIGVESQIMAAAILGGRALGRPMSLHEALRRSRQVFWPVVGATLLVGVILVAPQLILSASLQRVFGDTSEAPAVILTFLGALLSAPFAYIVTGIVLGDVGAGEAVRRSVRLARARWRLAFAVSAVGAVVGFIELFATGSGIDILARLGGALHLGFDSSAGTIALGIIVAAGVLAIGSLTFTLAALRDAPQVVAFLAMTGYGAGLDRSREPWVGPRRLDRWISIPMEIAIFIGVIAGIGGTLALT
jgi:hypothetical protein